MPSTLCTLFQLRPSKRTNPDVVRHPPLSVLTSKHTNTHTFTRRHAERGPEKCKCCMCHSLSGFDVYCLHLHLHHASLFLGLSSAQYRNTACRVIPSHPLPPSDRKYWCHHLLFASAFNRLALWMRRTCCCMENQQSSQPSCVERQRKRKLVSLQRCAEMWPTCGILYRHL